MLFRFPRLAVLALLWVGMSRLLVAESASDQLRPPSTSSPRATLQSLLASTAEAYRLSRETGEGRATLPALERAAQTLNLAEVAPNLQEAVGIETALLLREVFDRIELPPLEEVPGRAAVEAAAADSSLEALRSLLDPEGEGIASAVGGLKSWRLPGTQIEIERVEEGPRAGEYLFSPRTVQLAGSFFAAVEEFPYREGGLEGIHAGYVLTPGQGLVLGWDDRLPEWLEREIWDQTYWQLLLAVGSLVGLVLLLRFLLLAGFRVDDRVNRRDGEDGSLRVLWRPGSVVALPVAIALVSLWQWLIDDWFNLTGTALLLSIDGSIVVRYLLLAWWSAIFLSQAAEALVRARRLPPRGTTSQLLRLVARLLIFIVIPAIIIYAAQQLGLPAYSVVTGLGIGGLAFALAARDTLANLFGSLMIMFDRPYRIGDWIKLGGEEGTVEDIGFRSTRMRTFYDSLVSIPNSEAVSMPIDNMGQRAFRRVFTKVGLRYDTPPERIEAFLEGVKQILLANPDTRKDYFHVVFHDFADSHLSIMLYFFVHTPDWSTELVARQRVLLEIVRLAHTLGVEFAFPTQSLRVESTPEHPAPEPPDSSDTGELRRLAAAYGKDGAHSRPEGLGVFTPPHEEG